MFVNKVLDKQIGSYIKSKFQNQHHCNREFDQVQNYHSVKHIIKNEIQCCITFCLFDRLSISLYVSYFHIIIQLRQYSLFRFLDGQWTSCSTHLRTDDGLCKSELGDGFAATGEWESCGVGLGKKVLCRPGKLNNILSIA